MHLTTMPLFTRRTRFSIATASIAAALCHLPGTLLPQRADSARTADSTKASRHVLPPVVVTGSLSTFSPDKIGLARTVMSHADLQAEPVRAVVDALRRTAGIHIDEATGPLGPTIIRLRGGEETFTQVLMDGISMNENGGFLDMQGLTLVSVDRLEIARGPQSALYGSSAMSGVVQMFTRAGEAGAPRVETLVEAGGAQTYGTSLRASTEVWGGSDNARFAAGLGSSFDRGVYRLPNDVRANDGSVRADFLPGSTVAITAVGRFMDVDAKLPVRNPGVTRAPLDPNQRQARTRALGSVQAVWSPSDRWTHRALLGYYRRDFTYEDTRDSLNQAQFSSFVFDANYHYESAVQRVTARYVTTVTGRPRPALAVALSSGAEWGRESLDDDQRGDFGPASQSIARASAAVFGEGQASIGDRLSLLAGSRVEKFSGLEAAFVPRATAVLDVVRNRVSLRAAVSGAYKAPNIQDQFPGNPVIVANPDLKPETSHSREAGVDLRASRWATTLSATWFRQEYENLIRSVNYDTTGRQINRNLGRSRAAGVETEIAIHPRERWTVGADAAWTVTRILNSVGLPASAFPEGASLPFRPTHTGSAFVAAPLRRNVTVLVRARAVGRQTVLTDRFRGPRASVAPYGVLGATAAWSVSRSTDAYVQAENILDTSYETAYDRPGRPRTLAVGVRMRR